MNTCPSCGAIRTDEGQPTRRSYFACGTFQTEGFTAHRSDLCFEIQERKEAERRLFEANMTIFDVRAALKAKEHEGTRAAALRVVEERDEAIASAAARKLLYEAALNLIAKMKGASA